ncbi:MAG: hypothetical protein M3129_02710 [Thermoproteota archaeon]|nr:hypothetical protein [Thermoproteota archaeon]
MYSNNYKQLLVGSIILGTIIFFSNQLSSYAQELPEKTGDSSDETLDITIPSPLFSGQELEGGDIIEAEEEDNDQGNNGIPFELPFP